MPAARRQRIKYAEIGPSKPGQFFHNPILKPERIETVPDLGQFAERANAALRGKRLDSLLLTGVLSFAGGMSRVTSDSKLLNQLALVFAVGEKVLPYSDEGHTFDALLVVVGLHEHLQKEITLMGVGPFKVIQGTYGQEEILRQEGRSLDQSIQSLKILDEGDRSIHRRGIVLQCADVRVAITASLVAGIILYQSPAGSEVSNFAVHWPAESPSGQRSIGEKMREAIEGITNAARSICHPSPL